jgi:hypothetical protein
VPPADRAGAAERQVGGDPHTGAGAHRPSDRLRTVTHRRQPSRDQRDDRVPRPASLRHPVRDHPRRCQAVRFEEKRDRGQQPDSLQRPDYFVEPAADPVGSQQNAARLARAEAVLSSPSVGAASSAGAKVTFPLMWPRLRLEGAPGDAEGHGVPDRHVPAWNTSLRFGRSPDCSYPSFVSCSSAAAGGSALKMPRSSMTCCPSRLRM